MITFPLTPVGPLPVDADWSCQQSGECCTKPAEVVMTKEEAATIVHHAPNGVSLKFRALEGNMVALRAQPCPLYAFKTCLVYAHRPYNCRRFACMRPDVKAEPFHADGSNMHTRVQQSRVAARMAATIQRRAMRWARSHGWVE